jgi:hypothetical protein
VVLFIPCLVAGSHAASQLFFTPQPENLWDYCALILLGSGALIYVRTRNKRQPD